MGQEGLGQEFGGFGQEFGGFGKNFGEFGKEFGGFGKRREFGGFGSEFGGFGQEGIWRVWAEFWRIWGEVWRVWVGGNFEGSGRSFPIVPHTSKPLCAPPGRAHGGGGGPEALHGQTLRGHREEVLL